MSSPLTKIQPGETDASTEPRVLALDGTDADAVFDALASGTRRRMLEHLYDTPSTPAELAETTDTSLQNVHYHLEKLAEVELVESVGTRYSEKGAEMSVFAPTSEPLVIVDDEDDQETMAAQLTRIVGAISAIAVGSVLAQFLLGSQEPAGGSGGVGTMTTMSQEAATSEPGPLELAGTLAEPGMMVLVGGLLAMLVLEAVYRRR